MNAAGVMTPLPQYLSHKKVWALKISSVEDLGTDTTTDENPIVMVHFEDTTFEPRRFNLRGKPTPEAGWYYVQYPDGYESFSPAEAFDSGHTLIGLAGGSAVPDADLRSFPQEQIDNWFMYHTPTPAQLKQYHEVRTAAKIFAETINRHVPHNADKSAAMRLLREAVMTANAGIACHQEARGFTGGLRSAIADLGKMATGGTASNAGVVGTQSTAKEGLA